MADESCSGRGRPETDEWFVMHVGRQTGPLTTRQMMQAAAQGGIFPEDLIRTGTSDWGIARECSFLAILAKRAGGPKRAQ